MKLHPLQLVFAALIFSLGSCSKELSRETKLGSSLDSVNFYALIDGVAWKGDSLQEVLVTDSGVVSITGLGKTVDEISIVLPAFHKGVFKVNSQTPGYALYNSLKESLAAELYLSNTSADPSKAGGTVTITDIDSVNKTITGTFQFELYDVATGVSKNITAGFFNKIPYTGINGSIDPGGPSVNPDLEDTLTADVGGIHWEASTIISTPQASKLIISGTSASGTQALGIYMPVTISPGNYDLNYNAATYLATYDPDPNTFLIVQGNGSLMILENDAVNKRIKGTFTFTAADLTGGNAVVITNGYFSCSY